MSDDNKTEGGPIDPTPAVGHPDDKETVVPGEPLVSENEKLEGNFVDPAKVKAQIERSEPEGAVEAPLDPVDLADKITGGGVPSVPLPDRSEQYKSPVLLPSSQTGEILPGSAFGEKLKLDDKTLAELGVTSEDDLGDDIDLERSPLDGACVVVAMKNGMPVCQYCFQPFVNGLPQFEPAEIQIAKPSGMEQGLRVKVHGSCHLKRMQEISAGKRKS